MEVFNEIFQEILLPALMTLLSAAVTALVGIAIAAIRRWAEKQRSEWVKNVLYAATQAVDKAVAATNQKFVDDIRMASEDGRLTPDEARAAMNMSLRLAKENLGAELLAALASILDGGVDDWMMNIIEAEVGDQKGAFSYRVTNRVETQKAIQELRAVNA